MFGTATEIAKTADELGYDILWMAEHHFQHEGIRVHPKHHPARDAPGGADEATAGSAADSTCSPHGTRSGSRRTSPPRTC